MTNLTTWQRVKEWMGWHEPSTDLKFDGVSFVSVCSMCGDRILCDSQGGWFSVGPGE